MLHWHCVCDADNGVAVSVNDIIIKLVATTLKVNTVHRPRIYVHTACKHLGYSYSIQACMHTYVYVHVYICVCVREGI